VMSFMGLASGEAEFNHGLQGDGEISASTRSPSIFEDQ
jgi:hypothetical protein